jgi:hypothetical protein
MFSVIGGTKDYNVVKVSRTTLYFARYEITERTAA